MEVNAYTIGATGFALLGLMAGWSRQGRDGLLRGGLAAGLCVMTATVAYLFQVNPSKAFFVVYFLLFACAYRKEWKQTSWDFSEFLKGLLLGLPIALVLAVSQLSFNVGVLAYTDPVDGLLLLKFLTSLGLGCVVVLCAVLGNAWFPKSWGALKVAASQVLLTGLVAGLYLSAVALWYNELRDFSEIDYARYTAHGELLYQVDQREGGLSRDRLVRLQPESGDVEVFPGYWKLREGKSRVNLLGDWAALRTGLVNLKSGETISYQGIEGSAMSTFLPEFGGVLIWSKGFLRWQRDGELIDIAECTRLQGLTDTRILYYREDEGAFAFNFQTMTEKKLSDEIHVLAYNSEWVIVKNDGWLEAVALGGSEVKKIYQEREGRLLQVEMAPFHSKLVVIDSMNYSSLRDEPETCLLVDLQANQNHDVEMPWDEYDRRSLTWLPNGKLCAIAYGGNIYLADDQAANWKKLDVQADSDLSVNPWKEEFVVRTESNSLHVIDFEGELVKTYSKGDLI